ncbi:MAG: HisA/HisF-related TIM barrel protein [Sinobacteraceae bacterium]|nr:HisA/HisF-related TIM barrel protein [Nevskiaceae bacterium]
MVRLEQGDYARETVFGGDPVERARDYAAAGAGWLHLVDLDGARNGSLVVTDTLKRINGQTKLNIQMGGGVRTEVDVRRLLASGASRVVVGTVAVREPERVAEWLQRFGSNRLTLALDARFRNGRWVVASSGWMQEETISLDTLLAFYVAQGARHVLCTDIDRDGMLSGPNEGLYADLHARFPGLAVQASGGVQGLDDIAAIRASGAAGIVIGRALLAGRFALQEALAC